MALHREDLEERVCTGPDCDHTAADHTMYLHASCHRSIPPWAEYEGGVIRFRCSVCNEPVTEIAVASRPAEINKDN